MKKPQRSASLVVEVVKPGQDTYKHIKCGRALKLKLKPPAPQRKKSPMVKN